MRVAGEACNVCRERGECWWIMPPPLRLCRECYRAKLGVEPPEVA